MKRSMKLSKYFYDNNQMESLINKTNSKFFDRSKSVTKISVGRVHDECHHTSYIIEKYGNELKSIFNNYCNTDEIISSQMNSSNIIKLFRDAGLLKLNSEIKKNFGIKINVIDIILFKVATNNNNQSNLDLNNTNNLFKPGKRRSQTNSNIKIDFIGFICSIEMIANFLYSKSTNLIESIDNLIDSFILPLNRIAAKKNTTNLTLLNEMRNNSELVNIL